MHLFRRRILFALPALALLAGCGVPEQKSAGQAQNDAQQQDMARIAKLVTDTRGFLVGNVKAPQSVFVFFDPQCPHCGMLWRETLPLHEQANFIWVPVSFIGGKTQRGDQSYRVGHLQGAAMLSSDAPVQMMSHHETLLSNGEGGVRTEAMDLPEAAIAAIGRNTEEFRLAKQQSVPLVVWVTPAGELRSFSGAVSSATFVERVLGG